MAHHCKIDSVVRADSECVNELHASEPHARDVRSVEVYTNHNLYIDHANSEDPDQPAHMRRLIWVLAVHTCPAAVCTVALLKYLISGKSKSQVTPYSCSEEIEKTRPSMKFSTSESLYRNTKVKFRYSDLAESCMHCIPLCLCVPISLFHLIRFIIEWQQLSVIKCYNRLIF